jgi:hypothetical protein
LIVARITTADSAAAPATARTVGRHPIVAPSHELNGSPKRKASELPAKTTAVARPACCGPSSRAAIGATTDQNTPWPTAETTRATTATP